MQRGTEVDPERPSEQASRTSALLSLFVALWLDAIVIIYIALQLTRVSTPVHEWFSKIIELFGL